MDERVNASPNPSLAGPPRLFPALISGFNLVAQKAYLLLFPICLDLLLWFGPHIRLKKLIDPTIADLLNTQVPANTDPAPVFDFLRSFQSFTGRFNLLAQLSNSPIGVPSLMSIVFPVHTPFGDPASYEISSWAQAASGMLLFGLLGLLLSSLYIGMVARATATPKETITFNRTVWEFVQILILAIIAILLLIVISVPLLIFGYLLFLINPAVASIALTLCGFLLLWVLIPFIFTPHGIFAAGQNMFRSMLISGRLVRAFYPGVTLFLLAVLIISEVMKQLWIGAPDTSWLMFASVFGNAFVSTALLAASFVYYRNAAAWATRPRIAR